jgi:hypothetical protein
MPFNTFRRISAPEQASDRDWTITLALCVGFIGLLAMFVLAWF